MIKKILLLLIPLTLFISQYSFGIISYEDTESLKVWSPGVLSVDSNLPNQNESTNNSSSNPLKLSSGSAVLIDQNSGKVLYDYNMHEKLRPASVTKVMTILLIMEALDSGKISLTDKVPCTEDAAAMRWFSNLARCT